MNNDKWGLKNQEIIMQTKIKSLFVLSVTMFFCIGLEIYPQSDLASKQVGPQPDGSILVPTNQLLRPAGFQIVFPGRPVDLALSPDGKWLAVLNKNSLDLIRVFDRTIMQTLPFPKSGASYKGLLLVPITPSVLSILMQRIIYRDLCQQAGIRVLLFWTKT